MKRVLIPITIAAAVLATTPAATAQDADPFAGPARPAKPAQANPDDPFGPGTPAPRPSRFVEPPAELRSDYSIKYEAFSLDLATAASLMRARPTDVDLYKTVVSMVDNEKATQENLTVIRTKSGQRSKVEALYEYIYPTEWEPAETPNVVGVNISPPTPSGGKQAAEPPQIDKLEDAPTVDELPLLATPSTATAFETRHLGFTLEVDTVRGENGLIEAVIAPEHANLANLSAWGQGVSTLTQPEIESQRLSTSVVLVPGLPRLLGTMNRPPNSRIDPNAADRVWFSFLTGTPVK